MRVPSNRFRIRRLWTGLAVICITALAIGSFALPAESARAQTTLPATPAPEECMVAPRSMPLDVATPLAAEPDASPTPFTPPVGEPADDPTRQAIETTIYESIACANAGDLLRTLALCSDDYVAGRFTGDNAWTMDDFELYLSTPVVPAADEDRLALIEVRDVVLLPDRRAGAVVVTANATETFEDYVILIQTADRWLIDESVPLPTNR